MNQRLRSRPVVLSLAMTLPLFSGLVFAQEAKAPKTNAAQLPHQILPTGEEDATPSPRAQEFSARAAQSEQQTTEQKLREMTNESAEGLVTIHRTDGTIGMDLQGRFQSVMIATPTEDGRFVVSCHTGEDAREHAHHAAEIAAGKAPKLKAQLPSPATTGQPRVLEEK
jgi:hypothetical protein